MPSFGKASKSRLDTCDPRIVEIMEEVVKHFDCSILEGRRDQATQDEYFRTGRSKLQWPNSKHNCNAPDLSKAVDVAPYPIDWNDSNRFFILAGYIKGIAAVKGYKIRWGGDWDGDNDFKDQTFNDLPHFEIVD
jgi:peptidoglycan L-alanyl-D-glutamate endopeptidase CwlK